jgi:hypothetical protein
MTIQHDRADGRLNDAITLTQAADCFRNDLRRSALRLFAMAERNGLAEHATLMMIALETMGLSAFAHRGDREQFIRMARDAIAIAETGEFEQ